MNPSKPKTLRFIAFLSIAASTAMAADRDNDGLRDEVETGTGVYLSPSNTGTNPDVADTDGDSLPDGMEINLGTSPLNASSKVKRPNIIFIIADDLGYGDVGCFWQNQRTGIYKFTTPGLDAMAAQGVKMTHHYSGASICAPSRASLFLGQHQGNALIRDAEFDKPLPDNHNVAGMLKNAGYKTVHVGKAGLAGTLTNPLGSSASLPAHPLKRGFDRYFGYLRHEDGHEHYPRNGTAPQLAVIHNDYNPVVDAYQDLYSADAFTAFAKKTIIEETQQNPNRPFFLYLSYDTPHFDGCTAPTKTYPAGKGLNGGIQWQGSPSYVNTAINDPARVNNLANIDPSCNPAWFTGAKQYVSMVKRIDDSVADILQTLRDLAIDDNTLVVFTSDNGSSDKFCGATVFGSSAGFEGAKFDIWEGSNRVPTIAWWPQKIPATNQLSNIREVAQASAGYDWMATFAELAKTTCPAVSDGISLVPALTGTGTQKNHDFLFFDLLYGGFTSKYPDFPNHGGESRYQMQSIRIGDFTGVRVNIQTATDPFRIYNVVTDPKQSTNLAASMPAMQSKLQEIAVGARRKGNGLWTRVYDNARIPSVTPANLRSGLNCKTFEGYWQLLPDFKNMTPLSAAKSTTVTAAPLSKPNDSGLCFEGYISIATAGTYTFETTSSGPTCLWVHDGLALDNDAGFTTTKSSATVNLAVGLHPIRLNYRHLTGSPSLVLKYSGPGISLQPVPASALFTDGLPTILRPDSYVINRGGATLLDVLSNDTSEAGLTITSAGSPLFGSSAVSNGKINYTPGTGFIGTDSFNYEADDGWSRSTSSVESTVLYDNEIWFPFDEGQGTTVSGRAISSTPTGILAGTSNPGTSWINGKSGRALRLNGTSDQVNLSNLDLPYGSAPRTFAFWVRSFTSAPTENQAIFNYGSAGFGRRFTIRLAPLPSNPYFQTLRVESDSGVFSGTVRINDGFWHHAMVTLADRNSDGITTIDEIRFHVDGVPDAGRLDVPGLVYTVQGFQPSFGGSNHADNYNFAGEIDDFRIFGSSLDTTAAAFLSNHLPVTPTSGTNVIVSASDFDGDGYSNTVEASAGTDPEDRSDYPRITGINSSATGIVLTWKGVAGRTYTIEESADLRNWNAAVGVAPVMVTVSNPTTTTTVPLNGVAKRFFRLKIEETQSEQPQESQAQSPDIDGDRFSDSFESIAGTDPLDPNSFLKLRILGVSQGQLQVTWDGVAGRTYQIEESTNLTQWTRVATIPAVSVTQDTPGINRNVPMNGANTRFLRLAVSLSH